eukprot:scaffold2858_cov245-Ochromonas_danica.AAC.20
MNLLDLLCEQEELHVKSISHAAYNRVENNKHERSVAAPSTLEVTLTLQTLSEDKKVDRSTELREEVAAKEEEEDDLGEWLSPSSSTGTAAPIDLLETKVIGVPLSRLVWAPNYRFGNKLFPARHCDNTEAIRESFIKVWPLPADESVVEIFCPETTKTLSKLLVVKSKQLVPYWAENSKDKESNYQGTLVWNEKRWKAVQQALEKKYNAKTSRYVFDKIRKTANDFLSESQSKEAKEAAITLTPKKRKFENDDNSVDGETKDDGERSPPPTPLVKNDALFELLKSPSSRRHTSESKSTHQHHLMGLATRKVFAKVIGFRPDQRFPLLLDNDDQLRDTDLVAKVEGDGEDNSKVSTPTLLSKYTLGNSQDKARKTEGSIFTDESDELQENPRTTRSSAKKRKCSA